MKFYLIRFRAYNSTGQDEVKVNVRVSQETVLQEAVDFMLSKDWTLLNIHEIYYPYKGAAVLQEMEVKMRNGRFHLEYVPQEAKEK